MLRRAILAASRSTRVEDLVTTAPVTRDVVERFVAGATDDDALRVARALAADGLALSLDHLGEDTVEPEQATAVTKAYVTMLGRLHDQGLSRGADVSVKLSAIGQALDPVLALDGAATICEAAAAAGATVTLDMEDHTTTDATLDVVRSLRRDFPWVGAVLQAYLHRTEGDCRELAGPGSRVRLCKGAYREPASVAHQSRPEVARAYARCLGILLAGEGYPMVATHDPRLLRLTERLVARHARAAGSYEVQMLYGVRPAEQRRLVAAGTTVRVYVPYGEQWYAYLMRRLAERPANLAFFARAVLTRR